MGDTIKIRLANDLWWVEVPYKKAIKWAYEVSYLTDSSCFVIITDEGGDRTSVEWNRWFLLTQDGLGHFIPKRGISYVNRHGL